MHFAIGMVVKSGIRTIEVYFLIESFKIEIAERASTNDSGRRTVRRPTRGRPGSRINNFGARCEAIRYTGTKDALYGCRIAHGFRRLVSRRARRGRVFSAKIPFDQESFGERGERTETVRRRVDRFS